MVVSLERWVGKVAVVTGASAGIGASIAEALVDAGITVAGIARRKEVVEELSKKLQGKKGKLIAVQADMTNESDIVRAFEFVKNNLGPVHILINNAGILQNTNLLEGDAEKWRKTFETNVIGLSIATREAYKSMKENKVDGHIVHINAGLGHHVMPIPNINVYPASKFAVTALTETLRQELNAAGSKVKITGVSPCYVRTDFAEVAGFSLPPGAKAGPGLDAEDVADAVLYVLSTPPHVQVHELFLRGVGAM